MDKNEALFDFARQYLVGGVNAGVRVCKAFGNRPFYVSRGEGSRVYDLEGREYIDMCTSHGASFLGHKHPRIVAALQLAAELGILCSYETEFHSALAKKIVDMVPCAERVRFSGSGSETTMHTIRLAREYTGRDKILKFTGHFHGYYDYMMFTPYAPAATAIATPAGLYPESGGIPAGMDGHVIIVPDNDLGALERTMRGHKDEIAGIIMEPVHYNAGCIVPRAEYVRQVEDLAHRNGSLLIFDEVLSGFRMGPGGAQEYLGVIPDLCILGKAVGGGLPLSAICGRHEVMEHLRPLGAAQHSGTYNAGLVCILAGLAALEEYSSPGFYDRVNATGQHLYRGIAEIIQRLGVKARVQGLGARFGIYFGIDSEVTRFEQSLQNDMEMTERFITVAWQNGVYFHDYGGRGAHHHGFSAAHTVSDMDRALEGIEDAFKAVR